MFIYIYMIIANSMKFILLNYYILYSKENLQPLDSFIERQ